MEIVGVMFQSKANKEEFSGREYSYYAGIPLNVGDIVVVPTRNGTGKAQVVRVNISDREINFNPALLKTIEALASEEVKDGEAAANGGDAPTGKESAEQMSMPNF